MIADQGEYQRPFRILMLVVGLAMLGLAIPYGVANYKLDRCSQDLQVKLDVVRSEIAKTQSAIDSSQKGD